MDSIQAVYPRSISATIAKYMVEAQLALSHAILMCTV